MKTLKSRKISILLVSLLALLVFFTGCEKKDKPDDLIEMTKAYIDSINGFYFDHHDLEKTKEELSPIISDDFVHDPIEHMETFNKGLNRNGKLLTGDDALKHLYQNTSKLNHKYEISKIYKDLDPDRTYYKYVFVRMTMSNYDSDGKLFFQYTPIFRYFFVEKDGSWKLYSEKLSGYSNKTGEVPTRKFGNENIEFEEYKSFTIDLDSK